MTTRRGFVSMCLFGAGVSAGVGAASLVSRRPLRNNQETGNVAARLPTGNPRPGLALSLGRFGRELKQAFETDREIPDALRNLLGMNRIDAILHEKGTDIILVGDHDDALPAIALDDILIALRNSFSVSPEYAGALGCTIDPMPGADPWAVQLVKVFGMPSSAPMGCRHVAIDYDLKKVSAGLMVLPGIPSIYETSRLESAPCQLKGGPTTSAPQSATHRFWFTPLYPSRPRFVQDEQGILIQKPINVQLMSEEEFLKDGRRVGGAPPQPAAVKFTESVTRQLAKNEVTEYAHLRNDFRLIEVAKLIRFRNFSQEAIQYLLDVCPLTELPVRTRVRGIRRQESGEATCGSYTAEWQGGTVYTPAESTFIERYRRDYRGGVEARVEVVSDDFSPGRSDDLGSLFERVRKSRPGRAARWRVPA